VHVGEVEVAAAVALGKLFVVQTDQVQGRGVDVVQMHFVDGGSHAGFISGAGRPSRRRMTLVTPLHQHRQDVFLKIIEALLICEKRANQNEKQDDRSAMHAAIVKEPRRLSKLKVGKRPCLFPGLQPN